MKYGWLLFCFAFMSLLPARAETGREAWLRYAPPAALDNNAARSEAETLIADKALLDEWRATLPSVVSVSASSPVMDNARNEIIQGLRHMLGRTLRKEKNLLGTAAQPAADQDETTAAIVLTVQPDAGLPADGYRITRSVRQGKTAMRITATNERGVLYGAFALLRKIALGRQPDEIAGTSIPMAPVRWVDQWDNLNGTIERGYGGPSIFFADDNVRADLGRVREYARLLASIGINGININNVNANPRALTDEFLPQLARIADVLRPWGLQLSISVDLSSPQKLGGLATFDPADPAVAAWWRERVAAIYQLIPDFGGFTVKADSEGRQGPSAYGRTPADAANMLARALAPHGGVLFYRAFVYDHHLDWRNWKNDRARAAYDIFHPLDGQFADNVIIQIKHGPIDFQAREPVSPVFGGLARTNVAVELPVMQEYTGQQQHMVYLMPYWRGLLDFDLQAKGPGTPLKDILAGKTFDRKRNGYVAVVNVGLDDNWLGHIMGMANLYGYGRLAWNADLSPEVIADEWTRLTFGGRRPVTQTVPAMLLASWAAYEHYTGPLGAQTFTDITGSHFGPNVEASERNGWGQWHRGDDKGIGMDRSVATGTGFTGQYAPAVAAIYESVETTPDELILWFHHVPYTHRLRSGATVAQHVYDTHYAGAAAAEGFARDWHSLRGLMDDERFAQIQAKLDFQAGHARVWRDAICNWFLRKSGIADEQNRVGNYPGRVEAENMTLTGYTPVAIQPPENASQGQGVECRNARTCAAAWTFTGADGWYSIDVEYYDQRDGAASYRLLVGEQEIDSWVADNNLPAWRSGADASSRRGRRGVALRSGDHIRLEGTPDGKEPAGLDFIAIHPE